MSSVGPEGEEGRKSTPHPTPESRSDSGSPWRKVPAARRALSPAACLATGAPRRHLPRQPLRSRPPGPALPRLLQSSKAPALTLSPPQRRGARAQAQARGYGTGPSPPQGSPALTPLPLLQRSRPCDPSSAMGRSGRRAPPRCALPPTGWHCGAAGVCAPGPDVWRGTSAHIFPARPSGQPLWTIRPHSLRS